MVNPNQIKSQIRFQLEQLSTKNAHHDFEHLCRYLTRARICSNVIPATGPVSAGGDQGRDFETFRTYLNSSSIANSTFIGMISQKTIAFACSLQKDGITSKIKVDANTIMDSGSSVESVYFFSSSDIPISKIHKLKSWAKENHSIELEILDGQAISELLADREIFWIAEKFLDIPSEIYPRIDNDDWYDCILKKWKENDKCSFNYANFYEIKTVTRHATFETKVRQDLPFWITILTKYRTDESPPQLKRKAIYEISVASLRGLGTLDGQEDYLREYFDKIPELEDPVELEDANILLTYCIGASFRNLVQLTDDELNTWHIKILKNVEEKLKNLKTSGQKCILLEIRGHLSLYIDPLNPTPFDADNIEDAIKWWSQLILDVKNAPLFPLERFSDRLTQLIEFIGDNPKYDNLTQQVDMLLEERCGGFIAAKKCRDRAIEFYKNGRIFRGIDQLHQAKIKWFSEETLRGSVLSMLLLSQWYLELKLSFAAKYYALAVAFITLHSSNSEVKSYLPKALINAAECDYLQGSWCGFLDLTDIGLRTHELFSKDLGKPEEDKVLGTTLFHTTTLLSITKRFDLQLFESASKIVQNWNIDEYIENLLPLSENNWENLEILKIWEMIEEQLLGRPFGDIGLTREVTWSELGVIWKVKWNNDYHTTPVAEQFIAILQILLADLVDVDLCLIKTDVNIIISADEKINEPKVESIPSNFAGNWKVELPTCAINEERSKIENASMDVLSVTSSILSKISLSPRERLFEILEKSLRNGISMKVFVANPYEILYRQFISKEKFEVANRSEKSIPQQDHEFLIKENKDLGWYAGPGPGYSKESAEEYLKNRYARSIIPIKYSLKSLMANYEFRSTIEKLREDGWLDWHILSSVMSAVVNYHVNQKIDQHGDIDALNKLFLKFMNEPEKKTDSPVPTTEFTEEKLRFNQKSGMISTLKVLGLECHQSTPDFKGIDHFLRYRYNYWTDDIEHTDPFLFD